VQVPAPVELTVVPPPVIEQPAVPTLVTAYDTAPVPEPPLEVSDNGVPAVPAVEVRINAAWLARANVTVVAEDETAL
jgi:hypothetical protein